MKWNTNYGTRNTVDGRRSTIDGFTLFELVLVIVLVGIIAFTAFPVLKGNKIVQLDTATKKVESDIQYAQNLAVKTGEAHGFRTTQSVGNRTYEVYNVNANTIVKSPYHHNLMQEDLRISFPDIAFLWNVDIRFDQDGRPTFVAGSSPVTLLNSEGASKSIEVGSSGLIRIQ